MTQMTSAGGNFKQGTNTDKNDKLQMGNAFHKVNFEEWQNAITLCGHIKYMEVKGYKMVVCVARALDNYIGARTEKKVLTDVLHPPGPRTKIADNLTITSSPITAAPVVTTDKSTASVSATSLVTAATRAITIAAASEPPISTIPSATSRAPCCASWLSTAACTAATVATNPRLSVTSRSSPPPLCPMPSPPPPSWSTLFVDENDRAAAIRQERKERRNADADDEDSAKLRRLKDMLKGLTAHRKESCSWTVPSPTSSDAEVRTLTRTRDPLPATALTIAIPVCPPSPNPPLPPLPSRHASSTTTSAPSDNWPAPSGAWLRRSCGRLAGRRGWRPRSSG